MFVTGHLGLLDKMSCSRRGAEVLPYVGPMVSPAALTGAPLHRQRPHAGQANGGGRGPVAPRRPVSRSGQCVANMH